MNQTHELECPEEVLAAIAWYPEGLDPDERGAVEAHAADCATCREELAFVRGEGSPLPAPRGESDRVYARVLERIDAYEGRVRAAAPAAPLPVVAPPRRSRASFAQAPARAAAALLIAAALGALVTYMGGRLAAPEPVYQSAGDAAAASEVSAGAPAAALALDVVFRPDATAERIQSALRAIGGEIVSGPTQLGVYRVRLAPTADASAAATVLRGDGQGVATFAELAPR